MIRSVWSRVCALFRKDRLERELDAEVQSHLEMLAEEYVRRGMTPQRAREEARREFGGVEQIKEAYRDRRGLPFVETLVQDLRYGLRTLRKTPGFTAVAVLSLALGIGANAAVFTLIHAVMLRTLPVPDAHELVTLEAKHRGGWGMISFPMYRDLRAAQQVLTDIFASAGETPVRLGAPGGVGIDNVRVSFVTANYFPVLGVTPAAGRFFTAEEDRSAGSAEAAGSVAVLSDGFWERQFGRDPSVLGKTVTFHRAVCRVIGVAPRGFTGEALEGSPDLWVPLLPFSAPEDIENRHGVFTHYMGRLRPGVTRAQAQAEMTGLYRRMIVAEKVELPPGVPNEPRVEADYELALDPGATGIAYFLRKRFGKPLWIVMAVTGLVLAIACANVANLLLARAVWRRRELTVRLALGCARRRLVRQLLTESLLLASLGAAAGLGLAMWGSRALAAMVDVGPFRAPVELRADPAVLGFLAAAAMVAAIGFGVAPALRATRLDLAPALNDQARGSTGGRRKHMLSRNLVAAQIALSFLLLAGAGLLLRSIDNLYSVDLGFRPENVLIFDLAHNPSDRQPEAMTRVARAAWERARQVPGVTSASVSGLLLFSPSDISTTVQFDDANSPLPIRFNCVSPDYFKTVGMDLIAGRDIAAGDRLVTVINESAARRYFPSGAVGRVIQVALGRGKSSPVEIVGVVRDAKYNDVRAQVKPMLYLPITQVPRSLRSLEVRTSLPAAAIAAPVRHALLEVSRDIMIRRVFPLSAQVDRTLAAERLLAALSTVFGILALVLSSVGLYGVLSYGVAQRTGEIGIRMALGATRRGIVAMVLRESAIVVAAGIFAGLGLAWAATRLITSLLYAVKPGDPLTLASAAAVLLSVAAIAAAAPALRASRVEPFVALRRE